MKSVVFWMVLVVVALGVWNFSNRFQTPSKPVLFSDFMADDCMDSAAALSYYTVFSLPAILVLLLMLVSSVMDPTDVRGGLESQMNHYRGIGTASQ